MKFRRPTHATLVAYLALFISVGGSAYAALEVGSRDVTDESLRSRDLRDRKAVLGRDVKPDSISGDQVRERSLDASGFTAMGRDGGGTCDPSASTPVVCAELTLDLPQQSQVIAFGSGGLFSEGSASRSICSVRFDGRFGGDVSPGEASADNTDLGATEAFLATGFSGTLAQGPHTVTLECNQLGGDAVISQPIITAIALGV